MTDKLLAKDVGKQKLTQVEADEARARVKTVAAIEDFRNSDVQLVVEVCHSHSG
jgi:3-hydroxybutyryl-CoA dehydrogenase